MDKDAVVAVDNVLEAGTDVVADAVEVDMDVVVVGVLAASV